jgi:hypothetical protein
MQLVGHREESDESRIRLVLLTAFVAALFVVLIVVSH